MSGLYVLTPVVKVEDTGTCSSSPIYTIVTCEPGEESVWHVDGGLLIVVIFFSFYCQFCPSHNINQ